VNERHIALEGCLNLRDLGGYLTHDRREVRWGCLYRSGELCSLTDADLATIEGLGVRVVIDLRNEVERSARPDRLPSGVQLIERRSPAAMGGPDRTLEELIAAGEFPVRDDERVTRIYVDALDRLIPEIKLILELAVDAPERPMLFHCAAGKDRTGIVAAVLLGLLGVPVQTIIEDYELTTTYYATHRLNAVASLLAEHGVPPERVSHLVEARTPALEGCLEHLHDRWGSFDGYAITAVGLPADLPDRLRASLTTALG
jgi:protein-tyrosine phosphatase